MKIKLVFSQVWKTGLVFLFQQLQTLYEPCIFEWQKQKKKIVFLLFDRVTDRRILLRRPLQKQLRAKKYGRATRTLSLSGKDK